MEVSPTPVPVQPHRKGSCGGYSAATWLKALIIAVCHCAARAALQPAEYKAENGNDPCATRQPSAVSQRGIKPQGPPTRREMRGGTASQ